MLDIGAATSGLVQTWPTVDADVAGQTAAVSTADARSYLHLNDAAGNPVDVPLNSDTLIVATATWCPHCHEFINWLRQSDVQSRLEGLDLVFAFGDERAQGNGAIYDSARLEDDPGQVLFIDSSSQAKPAAFPAVYDPLAGDFSRQTDPYAWINNWLASRGLEPIADTPSAAVSVTSTADAQSPLHLLDTAGMPLDVTFGSDTLIVATATWCPHCHEFINWLREPGVQSRLDGLDVVFAYGDESDAGGGAIYDAAWLESDPGQAAIIDSASTVHPTSFPEVYDPLAGDFSSRLTVYDWIDNWLARRGQTPIGDHPSTDVSTDAVRSTADPRSAIHLADVAGNPVDVPLGSDTLIVSAATWCPHCREFLNWLREPAVESRLEGLDVVFAVNDESANGNGPIYDSTWLEDNPGQALLIDASSRAESTGLLHVYDPALAAFSDKADVYDRIDHWLVSHGRAPIADHPSVESEITVTSTADPRSGIHLTDLGGEPVDVPLSVDTLIVSVSTSCPHCREFLNWLREPSVEGRLTGLDVVFAVEDESAGGSGPLYDSTWLDDNPGRTLLVDPTSTAEAPVYLSVYNPATGVFSEQATVYDWIDHWLESRGEAPLDGASATADHRSTVDFYWTPDDEANGVAASAVVSASTVVARYASVSQEQLSGGVLESMRRASVFDGPVGEAVATQSAVPSDLRFQAGAVADAFLASHAGSLGLGDPLEELAPQSVQADQIGMTHLRYQQVYEGIPVFGAQAVVHLGADGQVSSANGELVSEIAVDTTPSLSSDEAAALAQAYLREQDSSGSVVSAQSLGTQLYVLNPSILDGYDDWSSHLVWEVHLYRDQPAVDELVYVDAHSGSIVFQQSNMRSDGSSSCTSAASAACTTASTVTATAAASAASGATTGKSRREVYDCTNPALGCVIDRYDPTYNYTFGRSEGQPPRGVNPITGSNATDVTYDRLGAAQDYWLTTFGRNGANGLGGMGDGSSIPYTTTRAYLTTDLCPGDGENLRTSIRLCSTAAMKDLLGHEYAHSIGGEVDLTYSGQSGSLCEAFAYFFGEAYTRYLTGSVDWLADAEDGCIFNYADPKASCGSDDLTGAPDNFYDKVFFCSNPDDSFNIHWNSAIPMKAIYLACEGGVFKSYTVTPVGIEKMEQILYRAYTQYFTSTTNFNAAYNCILRAAEDLYSPVDVRDVSYAFRAVYMNAPGKCVGLNYQVHDFALSSSTNAIYVVFNGDRSLGRMLAAPTGDGSITTAVSLTNVQTGPVALDATQFSYDSSTYTLMWTGYNALPTGYYELRLRGDLIGIMGMTTGLEIVETEPSPVLVRAYSLGGIMGEPYVYTFWASNSSNLTTVSVNRAADQQTPARSGPIHFTAVFSSPVTGFEAGDVVFQGSTAPGQLVATVTGSGTTYDIAVSGMTGSGQIVVRLPCDAAMDAAGYGNYAPPSAGNTNYADYDITPPVATIARVESGDPSHFAVRFDEPVTGFDAADVDLSGSTVPGTLQVSVTPGSNNEVYDVQISGITGSGIIVVRVLAGAAQDAAGNLNIHDAYIVQETSDYEITQTGVTLEQAAGQADPTDEPTVHFNVVFASAVVGFDASDVDLTGSTAPGTLTATVTWVRSAMYDVAVTGMTGSGTVVARIAAAQVVPSNDASTSSDNRVTYFDTSASLDVDGNGTADALTDGILILRYLFDPAGAWSYSDALGSGATRTTRATLRTFLDDASSTVLDVDGNGTGDALTDGILILRYLFAPAGAWNVADALGGNATRTTRAAIKTFLDLRNPGAASCFSTESPIDASLTVASDTAQDTPPAAATSTAATTEPPVAATEIATASCAATLSAGPSAELTEDVTAAFGESSPGLPSVETVPGAAQLRFDTAFAALLRDAADPAQTDDLFDAAPQDGSSPLGSRSVDSVFLGWPSSATEEVPASRSELLARAAGRQQSEEHSAGDEESTWLLLPKLASPGVKPRLP
jgi:Zn-dependent metalloprotease/glutaredoxin